MVVQHYHCCTFLYNVNNSGTASFSLSAKLFPCIVVQLSWEGYRTLNHLKTHTGTVVLQLRVLGLWLHLNNSCTWLTTAFTHLVITSWCSGFVDQLDFGFHRNSTGHDTLREDYLSQTYQKILDTTNSRGVSLHIACTSKSILTQSIINELLNTPPSFIGICIVPNSENLKDTNRGNYDMAKQEDYVLFWNHSLMISSP